MRKSLETKIVRIALDVQAIAGVICASVFILTGAVLGYAALEGSDWVPAVMLRPDVSYTPKLAVGVFLVGQLVILIGVEILWCAIDAFRRRRR